ncbi:hypothetical protein UYSO10_2887 [Kosakonia radicincitans]|nr:hypothetical protein UYSO10_2887 [Kosakonia radicincitans]
MAVNLRILFLGELNTLITLRCETAQMIFETPFSFSFSLKIGV